MTKTTSGTVKDPRPVCEHCEEKRPATCVGRYEDQTETTYACDECCGHGNEDGHCEPLEEDDE